MSSSGQTDKDRWDELQIDRLLIGLSADEQVEYEAFSGRMPASPSGSFEKVVASIDVGWWESNSIPLPEQLRKTIRDQAVQELSSPAPWPGKTPAVGQTAARSTRLPWAVAAACLSLTVFTLFLNRPSKDIVKNATQLRTELIATSKDVIELKWSAGPTPIAGAEGDVVWSPEKQQGFMRFRGLAVNETTQQQYQLWIFDKNQDEKTPVDGGVFDISSDGEVIIPIHAKLRVADVYLFAVTIEKPGGVVVSTRERLPLLAMVKKS